MNLTLRDITRAVKGQLVLGDPRDAVHRFTVDSRSVEPGSLFFALKGERVDGHDFAMAACRQGAAGVVVSRLDWLKTGSVQRAAVLKVDDVAEALRQAAHAVRREFKGPVVGITGSNGKTTTKQMTASVLGALGPGLFTRGNFNSQIGLPLILSELKPEDKWMVLEMGASAPGNIAALAEIARPTVGIITSIGPAHLETFGSVKRIAEAKWELMESLPADGVAIAPWGEPNLEPHIRAYSRRIVFFGEDSSCPVRATAIEAREKISFVLHAASQSARVILPIPGRVNVGNALAAAAAGWVLGIPLEKIAQGLESFEPPKMRMEVHQHPSGAVVINDAYNANPASMMQSVRWLVEGYPAKRRVAVLGPMKELGGESEKLHFHLGAELGRFNLDRVLLIGDETKDVREGAVSAGAPAERFTIFPDIAHLAASLEKEMKPETVVLFKGSRAAQLEKAVELIFKNKENA